MKETSFTTKKAAVVAASLSLVLAIVASVYTYICYYRAVDYREASLYMLNFYTISLVIPTLVLMLALIVVKKRLTFVMLTAASNMCLSILNSISVFPIYYLTKSFFVDGYPLRNEGVVSGIAPPDFLEKAVTNIFISAAIIVAFTLFGFIKNRLCSKICVKIVLGYLVTSMVASFVVANTFFNPYILSLVAYYVAIELILCNDGLLFDTWQRIKKKSTHLFTNAIVASGDNLYNRWSENSSRQKRLKFPEINSLYEDCISKGDIESANALIKSINTMLGIMPFSLGSCISELNSNRAFEEARLAAIELSKIAIKYRYVRLAQFTAFKENLSERDELAAAKYFLLLITRELICSSSYLSMFRIQKTELEGIKDLYELCFAGIPETDTENDNVNSKGKEMS